MDEVEPAIRRVLKRYVGEVPIEPKSRLNDQTGLAGDDAYEFLEEIRQRFSTSFSGFAFGDYFPGEAEALVEHLLRLAGIRRRRKPLTFEHLVKVVESGRWFEP